MAWEWKVYLVDRRATGGRGEQDLTARFDAKNSHLVGTAGDKIAQSTAIFRLTADDDYWIDSFTEFWAGYRDSVTHEWDNSRALYAGFVTEHEGTFRYKRHIFECTVSNFNILFDRADVLTWPPLDPSDPPVGFETGKSIRDWLIGTVADDGLAYDGVIPAHYDHWNNGGVAPVFDTIILTNNLPAQGMSELYAYYGFLTIRALIDEIMKVAKFQARIDALDIKPSYFWRPIGVGTEIIKQFCCIDLNDQSGTSDGTYALDPAPGEFKIGYPYRHRRNAQNVRTRVTVKGEPSPTEGLVYFSYLKPEGEAAYPSAYHLKRPGWAGAPINESKINTNADAEDYAMQIGDDSWGPEGTITFPSRQLRQAGQLFALKMAPDGQTGQIYPLIEHETSLIPSIDNLTLGRRMRGIEDILIPRPDAPFPVTDAGAAGGGGLNASAAGVGYSGANVANAPRQRPIVNTPVHGTQNLIKAFTREVPGLVLQASSQAALTEALEDTPPAAGNIWETRLDDEPLLADCTLTVWADRYGTPHKQKLATFFESNRTNYLAVAERMTIREARIPTAETGIGISFTYVVLGTTGSLTTVTIPFEVLPGEEIQITCSGLTGGHVSLTLVTGDPL